MFIFRKEKLLINVPMTQVNWNRRLSEHITKIRNGII